jgi:hypothetical protein
MFGFGKIRPPLTTAQRVGIELLMRRTMESVGREAMLEAEIVTDLSMLNLDKSGPEQLVESAAHEVLGRMWMRDARCQIVIVPGTEIGYLSTYRPADDDQQALIRITEDTVADPLRTVMELAYQYAKHYWHTTPGRLPLDSDPPTTHLLPICAGLGVLASDACLYDQQWSQAGWAGWSISRSGYYTADEIGYVLALVARARGEVNPKWARSLRPDSKVTAQRAWRYFAEHEKDGGGLLFDARKIPDSVRDMSELADWLRGDDPAFALAAGHALGRIDELSSLVIEAAIEATHNRDQDIVPVAARLLGGARRACPPAEARVRQLIGHTSPPTSLAAMLSAHALGIPLGEYRAKIVKLLDQYGPEALPLIGVISEQGKPLGFLEAKICEHLAMAIREIDDEWVSALLECLQSIVDAPQQSIERRIKSPEIRREALQRLAVAR